MPGVIWLAWLSVAMAKPPAGSWVPLADGTHVCVPSGKLKGDDAAERAALYSQLAQGELDPVALVAMANAHPDDACLAAATATALELAGGDPALILKYAGRAWLPLPHPELARLMAGALLLQNEPERARAILDRWLAAAPDYPELRALRAEAGMQSGDSPAALDDLLALHRGGDHRRDASLADALYKAGRMGDYLRVIAGSSGKLAGAEAAIIASDDPLAALRAHLGLTTPGQALIAQIETTMGLITCELYPDVAPVTVASFWGLATGKQTWTDPRTGGQADRPLYDGTIFHRMIPGFMIQGGDPLGTGSGGPGYAIPDEVTPYQIFDKPGRLAMANAGPDTGGSQFFVTVAPAAHLNGKHTIFGQCTPVDLVDRIVQVPADGDDRPERDVTVTTITFAVRSPGAGG